MTSNKVFVSWIVALSVVVAGGGRPLAAATPTLSLPPTLTVPRMAETYVGHQVVTVGRGSGSVPFTLSGGGGLAVSPTSGTAFPGINKPFTFDWLAGVPVGPVSGTITLSDSAGTSTMTVTGDLLANRILTAAPVGTLSQSVRTMVGSTLTTTLGTGSDITDDDNEATRVDTVPSGRAVDPLTGVSVTYQTKATTGHKVPTSSQFNGPGQTVNLNLKVPSVPGVYSDFSHPLNIAPSLLTNGEAASVGAQVQAATLGYNVDVVAQRQLAVATGPVTFNNVLSGSYKGTTVTSTNATGTDSNHATSVVVAPGGAAVAGPAGVGVLVQATTISSGTATVYGQVTGYRNPGSPLVTSSGTVRVVTAEAPSVGDTTPYPSKTVTYQVGDVGVATLGSGGGPGPTLTGLVPQGFTLGTFTASPSGSPTYTPLSSRVNPAGTLAGGSTNIYGPVGSEADILDSTPVSSNTTVSMQWRARNAYEANQPGNSGPPSGGSLPSGSSWLASDVVTVGINSPGAASPLAYAVQMSFNNNINAHFDPGATALSEFQEGSLYLAQLTSNGWTKAGTGTGLNESLADFLNGTTPGLTGTNSANLLSLVGSWGVDTTSGQYSAWAIMNHGGTLAVVPEPATVTLLLSAGGAALLLYRRSRRQHGFPAAQ
ncbi:MAG: PEP-CTERM sorting domain-containing protein [Thermoguttaceae bacterium]